MPRIKLRWPADKIPDKPKIANEWIKASRAQRAAYVVWQNASGEGVAPALAAYVEATRDQREIENNFPNAEALRVALSVRGNKL